MSKAAYIGVNGIAHKVKKMYVGVNGVARKVKKAYVGVNGVARLFFTDSIKVANVHNLALAANGMGSAWNSKYCIFSFGWSSDSVSSICRLFNCYDTNLTYTSNDDTHSYSGYNGRYGGTCGTPGSSEEYAIFGEGDSVSYMWLYDNNLTSKNFAFRYRSPEGLGYYGFTSWNNEFWQIGGSHRNRGYPFWYHVSGTNSSLNGNCVPGRYTWLDNSAVAGNGNYLIVAGGHGTDSGDDDGYGSWTSYKVWSINKTYTVTQLTDYPAALTGYRGSNGSNYAIFPVPGQSYAYAYDNNLTLHQIAAVPNPGARAISYKNMHLWPAEGTYMRWYDDNTLTLHSLEDLDTSVWGGVATGIVGTYLLIAGGYRYDSSSNTNIRSDLVQAYNLEGLS